MIPLKHNFRTAVTGLKTNKSRSLLTILGIVIGIASIILIMSVGQGAQDLILNEIKGMGSETIVIRPGREPKGPTDVAESIFLDSLKKRDIDMLIKNSDILEIEKVAPAVIVPGSVSYQGETFRAFTLGWDADFMADIYNLYPAEGNLFDATDIKQKASVAMIGSKVKNELFGESNAVGEKIKIKNKNFRVIGVYQPRGQVAFFNIDEVILIPYSTAQSYLLGIDHYHEVIVKAKNADSVDRTVAGIKAVMRESHGITDPEKDDFFVVTQQGLVDQVKTITNILTIFLTLVVAVALVVGGIGVMNIMLVSVTERTREIGLRKSLGATNNNIMNQFLMEAIILTVLGGGVGILLGAGMSLLVAFVLKNFLGLAWSFNFPVLAAVLGLAVSALVGLVFGIYPARQASKKSPIEALRYE
jgi:putative ABC transport system permease protein